MKLSVKLFILVLMFGCSRPKVDYLGPAYISAPEDFGITTGLSVSPVTAINLTSGAGATFHATFSSTVTWVLSIKGQKSGAVHQVSGTSNALNNVTWNGHNDGVEFFRAGETVTATLTFFGTTATSSVTFTISTVQNYMTCGTFPRYADFETPAKIGSPYYNQYLNSASTQGCDSAAIDYNGNRVPSVQGLWYYYIKGLGPDPAFVSGLEYLGSNLQNIMQLNPHLPADPDNVWVNIFIYGTGDANAGVDVQYKEADASDAVAGYQDTRDDAFVAHLTLNHKGWKLFSFKYSDLVPSTNTGFGSNGNKIHEPNKIVWFDVVLLKRTNPSSPVEVYFDYPIFTVGGPFKPCR